MRSWHSVPMEILALDLDRHSGSESGTTYRVIATYTYNVNGIAYEGKKVSLSFGSDNIGSFHKDAYAELRQYQNRKTPFPGWVNPKNPHKAILFRDMRWGLFSFLNMFAGLFGGFGFGLIAGVIIGRKNDAQTEALQVMAPSQPWLHRPDWKAGVLRTKAKQDAIGAALVALLWNLASTPLLLVIPNEIIQKGRSHAAWGLIFPLAGIALIIWAMRYVIRWKRFGNAILRLKSNPARIGEQFSAELLTFYPLHTHTRKAEVALTCTEERRVRSGNRSRTVTAELWKGVITPIVSMAPRSAEGSLIPITIDVPSDQPTTPDNEGDTVTWHLQIRAEIPGVDYLVKFEVPVFSK